MSTSKFRKAKSRIKLSVGESIRVMRELQELSQNELAQKTGIPQSTISALENDRIGLGHPGGIAFPLQANIYKIFDEILESGIPLVVVRNGKRLKIEVEEETGRLSKLKKRKVIKGDASRIDTISWNWMPSGI